MGEGMSESLSVQGWRVGAGDADFVDAPIEQQRPLGTPVVRPRYRRGALVRRIQTGPGNANLQIVSRKTAGRIVSLPSNGRSGVMMRGRMHVAAMCGGRHYASNAEKSSRHQCNKKHEPVGLAEHFRRFPCRAILTLAKIRM